MIARLGKEIDNPESVYYWAYKVTLYGCIASDDAMQGSDAMEWHVVFLFMSVLL